MLKRVPRELVEQLKQRYAKPLKPKDRTTLAEQEIRREFKHLMDLRKTDMLWPRIVSSVFGPPSKRAPGLSSRNAYRLLRKVAAEKGIDLERMHN